MVRVTVLRAFYDMVERVDRNPGDTFDATEKRAAYIDRKLPGYVTYEGWVDEPEEAEPEEAVEEAVDYAKLTVAKLRELCAELGIEAPKKAKKAELVSLLEG